MNETDRDMSLMGSHCDKAWTYGMKAQSDTLLAFLKCKNASTRVFDVLGSISFSRQMALPDGILFSGREILRRNEFINGDFIVIGARRDYAFYVINLHTGSVGVISSHEEGDSIPEGAVVDLSSIDFSFGGKQKVLHSDSKYLVPEYFNVGEIPVMRALSNSGLGRLSQPSKTFRRWIHNAGIPNWFCFYEIVPMKEMSAGACVIFPYTQIFTANYEARRRINPYYLVIGCCPNGDLVVLDTSYHTLSIGYVAIEEVGDEKPWDDYCVHISRTLGSFLHDSNFLGILPDDYYQARKLGY